LLALRDDITKKIHDPKVASLLTEKLVTETFNEAWRLQFEEDMSEFEAAVRDLVTDAAEGEIGARK